MISTGVHVYKRLATVSSITVGAMMWASVAFAAEDAEVAPGCEGFGPQTPRDIDQLHGTNDREFSLAPEYDDLNLCNIHFHHNAEHKAKDFAIFAGDGDNGLGGGYQCAISQNLSAAELAKPAGEICGGLKPGDTIEVHWVHTSCDVTPGPGLDSCLNDACANPDLRVETQVFTLVNDSAAMNFADMAYGGYMDDGLHQAKYIPTTTGAPVEFLGSTTGPSFSESQCSPLQVSWRVRPQCAKLDINSLGKWCADNPFDEVKAQGVRKLVTNPALLSEIE